MIERTTHAGTNSPFSESESSQRTYILDIAYNLVDKIG